MTAMECAAWEIRWACPVEDVDEALLELARSSAQEVLWGLSGRRYGVCETTETFRLPCDLPCALPWGTDFGPGVEYRLGADPRRCCRLYLPSRPPRAVLEVKVNGEVVDPATYTLERHYLMRIGSCWPCEQECDVAPIEVSYAYGVDPPALATLAMGELACEFLAALTGADCRLPSNAISVTRQGVTVDLGNVQTLYEEGRLGLPISDAFLRQANPGKLMAASAVYSPDLSRRAR